MTVSNMKAKETFDKVMARVKAKPINVLPAIKVEEKPTYDTYEDVNAIKKRFSSITSPNNWNQVDVIDKQTWDKLISQFWVDTRIPVSKDMQDYDALTPAEKTLMQRVFVGLTTLDTLQADDGVLSLLISGEFDGFEVSVLNKIAFDESIHNKSYSTIFQTLMTNSQEIDKVFQWSMENEYLQYKVKKIQQVYAEGSIYQKLIADVFLETFLFYSGFYLPVLWRGSKKMMNTSEIIALIIRDESVHGQYLGNKYQKLISKLTPEERQELHMWATELMYDLYMNELSYTETLYDEVGYTDDVKIYLRYRANVAFGNLGMPPLFSETANDVNPIIIKGTRTTSTNQDFFSTVKYIALHTSDCMSKPA